MAKSKRVLGLGLGAAAGYVLGQQAWVLWRLLNTDVVQTLATPASELPTGVQFIGSEEHETYTVARTLEDGIERVVYRPKDRRYETPIVMQHGMWHGAWCWASWQALLATWGWEVHAHSLPGHGASPEQRPIRLCTLDYYLKFLKAEIDQLPQRPVVIGHSMGGALIQWYLKYVGDLPAAVLVAPWGSHSMIRDGLLPLVKRDPLCIPLMMASWDATPMVLDPLHAAQSLLGAQSLITPEDLFAKLGPESALILYQHNPPFWQPPTNIRTPLLWIAAQADTLLPERIQRESADYYGADYVVVEQSGHNVMHAPNQHLVAEKIHNWLVHRGIS